jgi:hypothetical protein
MGLFVMRMVPLEAAGYIRIDSLMTADRYLSCSRGGETGREEGMEAGQKQGQEVETQAMGPLGAGRYIHIVDDGRWVLELSQGRGRD